MRCLSGAKLVDDCVCAALRASVTSICSVEVFLYWFCIVSPTGTFPLDSFLLVVVGMVGVRARVFLFGVRQNKAIRSFLEGSSFYFLTPLTLHHFSSQSVLAHHPSLPSSTTDKTNDLHSLLLLPFSLTV